MNLEDFEKFIKESTNDEIAILIHDYTNNQDNIEQFKTFLLDPNCSPKVQIVASSFILHFIRNSNNILEIEQHFSLTDWCQQVLISNNSHLETSTINTISNIFGIILYKIRDTPDMDEKFNQIANPQMPPLCQLYLMNETVEIFSHNHKTTFFPMFTRHLKTIHQIAINFMNKDPSNSQILKIGLDVIYNCLTYGQISNSEELVTIPTFSINVKIANLIEETVQFLFDIFIKYNLKAALESLYFIIKTKNSNCSNLSSIIISYTRYLSQIFSALDVNYESTLLLTQILLEYSKKLNQNSELPDFFDQLFMNVFGFTNKLFESIDLFKEHEEIYSNLVQFFGFLSNIPISQDENSESFSQRISDVLNNYTVFLSALLSTEDPEFIATIIYDNIMIIPYQQWMSNCSIVLELIEFIKQSNSQFNFALFLKIVCEILKSNLKNSFDRDEFAKRMQLFIESMSIITASSEILKSSQMSPIFEYSILSFIKEFNRYSITSELPSKTDIIVTFIVRIIESFQNFSMNPPIISLAIDTFKGISFIDVDSNEDYPKYKKIVELFLHNFQTIPFFVNESSELSEDDVENRQQFCGLVYSIANKFQHLFVVHQYLTELVENDDMGQLIIFLNGILLYQHELIENNKIEHTTSNTFRLIVDFIIDKNLKQFFVDHGFNEKRILSILTLYNNLLSFENIKFPRHSPNGVILFDIVSESLLYAINLFIEHSSIELLENLSPCLAYLLKADYIMFNAFHIFGDHKLSSLLEMVRRLFLTIHQRFQFKICIDYPIIFDGFCKLVSALISKHFDRCEVPFLTEISNFITFCYQQNQVEIKKVVSSLRKCAIEFVQQINSKNAEIKQNIQQDLIILYGITWEQLLNKEIYQENCDLIKQLLICNESFFDLFADRFKTDCVNEEEFLNYMDAFRSEFPKLISPGSLSNDFNARCEYIQSHFLDHTKYFSFFNSSK